MPRQGCLLLNMPAFTGHTSIQEPGRASRRLHAGCRSGSLRHPPSLSRSMGQPPVLTSPNLISTLPQRFACARLSRPCLPGSCPDVSATLPSRPGEFHPEPLTDPDVTLSCHPARATARRLPPSAEHSGSSRFDPVGPSSTAMTCPLCSAGITPLQRYYGAVRPSPAHRYFRPRGWSRLCLFP